MFFVKQIIKIALYNIANVNSKYKVDIFFQFEEFKNRKTKYVLEHNQIAGILQIINTIFNLIILKRYKYVCFITDIINFWEIDNYT